MSFLKDLAEKQKNKPRQEFNNNSIVKQKITKDELVEINKKIRFDSQNGLTRISRKGVPVCVPGIRLENNLYNMGFVTAAVRTDGIAYLRNVSNFGEYREKWAAKAGLYIKDFDEWEKLKNAMDLNPDIFFDFMATTKIDVLNSIETSLANVSDAMKKKFSEIKAREQQKEQVLLYHLGLRPRSYLIGGTVFGVYDYYHKPHNHVTKGKMLTEMNIKDDPAKSIVELAAENWKVKLMLLSDENFIHFAECKSCYNDMTGFFRRLRDNGTLQSVSISAVPELTHIPGVFLQMFKDPKSVIVSLIGDGEDADEMFEDFKKDKNQVFLITGDNTQESENGEDKNGKDDDVIDDLGKR